MLGELICSRYHFIQRGEVCELKPKHFLAEVAYPFKTRHTQGIMVMQLRFVVLNHYAPGITLSIFAPLLQGVVKGRFKRAYIYLLAFFRWGNSTDPGV